MGKKIKVFKDKYNENHAVVRVSIDIPVYNVKEHMTRKDVMFLFEESWERNDLGELVVNAVSKKCVLTHEDEETI